MIDWYERFARGRPGAIVVEATGIRDVPSGPLLRIGHDRFLPGLRRLVDPVTAARRMRRVHDLRARSYEDALGANVLIGGSNRSVALQPLSVQGQVGLNVAAGVGALELHLAQ